ncbi:MULTISPECIES: TonB-dependent receptor [unclassified Caulobacter]|uniref:TonB-dependent receptor n=1 Tax=unclassified Caulobacter TaxID=2648921 RepID=UPI000D3D2154|nr:MULTISPECIES: TonB-dependent receptor [unclassified Caulobacter]PTS87055.1 TonB-dependent receptor [Caulobacter sp. HMWF009]PTT08990.1 TonB-dependent receptor [Caulobacter sp. HMWF025]
MRSDAGRRWALVFSLACVAGCASTAAAAQPRVTFNIPAKPLKSALIDFAVQAGASISTQAAAGCAPTSRPLRGRYTLQNGLTRLLKDTGCGFRLVDSGAIEIIRLPPKKATRVVVAESPSPAALVDELVVVANQRLTPADRLAYAVSGMDGQKLSAQGLRDARDLALAVPSMTVTNLGPGRDKILLRGLSDGPLTGRTQSMVGLYLDDTRLTYNAPNPDMLLIDMARVEVLQGPQGALYGSGSLGGVLHLVSRQPRPDRFEAWAEGLVGTTRGGGASTSVSGMVNMPILADRGAIRLVLYREQLGGYIDDAGLNLTNVNRTRRAGGRLNLKLDLPSGWSMTAGGTAQFINSDDSQYSLASEAPYTRRNRLREPHDNDFAEAHLNLRGNIGRVQARWTVSAVDHDITSRYDASLAPPVSLLPGPAAYDDDDRTHSLVTEGTLAAADDDRIQWLAGAFLARTRQDIDLRLTRLADAPLAALSETRHDTLDEAALYGEATLPLGRAFSATVGGRLFTSKTRVDSRTSTPTGPVAAFKGALERSGFAPKLVLSYAPSDTALIYLQAAEGYRSGGFNTTGPPGQVFSTAGQSGPDRLYAGDELWSLETGGKTALFDGRLRLRAAAFMVSWKDIQSDELLTSGLPFTANIGDGRNLGLELEGGYRLGRLQLGANMLWNAPELEKANPAFPARGDLNLAGVPHQAGGLTAHYDRPLGPDLNLTLDGRYAYVGHSHLTFDAATAPRMGGYATGRLALGLTSPRWTTTLAVDNPTNARSDTFAYGNPFSLRTTAQGTPLRPRTLSLTTRATY